MNPCETKQQLFLQHLQNYPNPRRVSLQGKEELITLLANNNTTPPLPSSQKEFSRRNYVRKTFRWDENRQELFAVAKKGGESQRQVVTEDAIVDTVEHVHSTELGHAGWDATWKSISESYYGILRADVIFLLKLCETCAVDPRKRPKSTSLYPMQYPYPPSDAHTSSSSSSYSASLDDGQNLWHDPAMPLYHRERGYDQVYTTYMDTTSSSAFQDGSYSRY